MKCTKCHKDVVVQNGINEPDSFVCNDCIKKRRARRTAIIIGCVILLGIVGITVYLTQGKKTNATGFDGITNIQDSVNVSVQKPAETFDITKTVAQANPVDAGKTIDNIESFKRVFAEKVQ